MGSECGARGASGIWSELGVSHAWSECGANEKGAGPDEGGGGVHEWECTRRLARRMKGVV
jgi:hypothetical protein